MLCNFNPNNYCIITLFDAKLNVTKMHTDEY